MIVAHGPNDLPIPASGSGCTIALTTLELAAPSFGLGACWGGYFNATANNYPPLRQALDLPENHDPYGAMMIGYPTYGYHRIPLRKDPDIKWR
ncbi:MAG: nitroreductase family protein [Desulfobacteraceae bacterium]|nr:nitroreductase family protein [Desulfobacteraceae bacterium]